MATKLNWDQFGRKKPVIVNKNKNSNGEKSLRFVQLGKKRIGTTYELRPIGDAVAFYTVTLQQEDGGWKSVNIDVDKIEEYIPLLEKYNLTPKATYAYNVLNRKTKLIEILKGPESIFKVFAAYKKMAQIDPGRKIGADFTLQVTGNKGNDYYKTDFKEKTTLTEEELAMINKEKLFKLDEIFRSVPLDKFEEFLGLKKSAANADKQAAPAKAGAVKEEPESVEIGDSKDEKDELEF